MIVKDKLYEEIREIVKDHNLKTIESCDIKCIKSRLKRENDNLTIKYPNSITFIDYDVVNKIVKFVIKIDEGNKLQKYTFLIDNKYPFNSPRILFNDKPYSGLLQSPSSRFNIFLEKLFNKKCLCCSSLNCVYNWSPGINLSIIINDIDKMRIFRRIIFTNILVDQIKDKYLNSDIVILDYLFDISLINN
jgi:ubiquitin-protein ligase